MRQRIEMNPRIERRTEEYKVGQQKHFRREFIALVAGAIIGSAIGYGVVPRIFKEDPEPSPTNLYIEPKIEIGTEIDDSQIIDFTNFVKENIDKNHDLKFWGSLTDFLITAPKEDLKNQLVARTYPEGRNFSLRIHWPPEAPINREAQPTIMYQVITGDDGSGSQVEFSELIMRIDQSNNVNNTGEGFNNNETLFVKEEVMKKAILAVTNRDAFGTWSNWETDNDAIGVIGVTYAFKNETEEKLATLNKYGYVFFTRRIFLEKPVKPVDKPPITA